MGRPTLMIRSFDSFVQTAVRRYWERPGRDLSTFLALLFATRRSLPVVFEQLSRQDTQRKALLASAGGVAITVLLRTLLGGPIGLLLTAGSLAALAKVAVDRAPEIRARSGTIRTRLGDYERELTEAFDANTKGALSEEQLDLVVEGLLSRLLDELATADAPPPDRGGASDGGFAAHVARQRDASRH
jgi:hypothetical protein